MLETEIFSSVQSAAAALVLVGAPSSTAQAQVSPPLSSAAQDACKASAVAKGFQVAEVVSVEPKARTTDGVDVVLSLTRDSQPFKLTCGYTAASGAAMGETQAPATTTATNSKGVEQICSTPSIQIQPEKD